MTIEKLTKVKIDLLEVPREMPKEAPGTGIRPATAAGAGALMQKFLQGALRLRRPEGMRRGRPRPPNLLNQPEPIRTASRANRMRIADTRASSVRPIGLPPPRIQPERRPEPMIRRQAASRDLDQERFMRTLENNRRVREQSFIEPRERTSPQTPIRLGQDQNQPLSLRWVDNSMRMAAQGSRRVRISGVESNPINTGDTLRVSERIREVEFQQVTPNTSVPSYSEDYFGRNAGRFREHGR